MKTRRLTIDPIIVAPDFLSKNSCHSFLQHCRQQFNHLFLHKKSIEFLMQQHVAVVDEVLRFAWKKYVPDSNSISLIAIGGYGRGELHPYSDIDLLILSPQGLNQVQQEQIHQFVQFCWDINLEIRHSVRTSHECLTLATEDVSVFTNLLEASLLEGDEEFSAHFLKQALKSWSDLDFYNAKMKELVLRHHKYGDTFSNLEPNIKNGPAGLRDIHTVFWLATKILPLSSILHPDEFKELFTAQDLLWQIRYALHFFAERKEDRLLFDYQKRLAIFFEFNEENNNEAVERFMKHFFVTLKPLREILDLVFQYLHEYLQTNQHDKIIYKSDLFTISEHYVLSIIDAEQFKKDPDYLMKLFLFIATQEKIERLSSDAIRLVRQCRYINKINPKLFLDLLKQKGAVDNALLLMNRFAVLGHIIEPFQHIIGQMQYDLFHVYTVDQHSLFVVKQLCQFRQIESQKKFPLCYELMNSISQPELLFIAAIFHDIGKGQGKDHSELGGEYVKTFCKQLELTDDETLLVSWLVKNHLLMSHTAQKNDIYDLDVIKHFSEQVGTLNHLYYLYLLTVSDICSTNPKLWNSWKDTLLQELFRATKAVLTKQSNKLLLVKDKKQEIMQQLSFEYSAREIKKVWRYFDKDYFVRETIDNIAWQTKNLLQLAEDEHLPAIFIRMHLKQGAFEIFIVSQYHVNLFAITTTVLSNLSFNIAEATIRMTKEGLSLSSYMVLVSEKNDEISEINFENLKRTLTKHYNTPDKLPSYRQRRLPRELKYFLCPTDIKFSVDKKNNRTVMELTSLDRPGLLAQVSQAFVMQNIHLQMAKIMTMGEKAEDIFFIADANNAALYDENQQMELKNKILFLLEKK